LASFKRAGRDAGIGRACSARRSSNRRLASRSPAPTLRARQLRRQLVATAIAEPPVFDAVGLSGLLQDLARDPLVIAIRVRGGVGVHFVPSTAITSTCTNPASAHSSSTSPNSSPSARSCRWRKRAIVV
jgi:hypothetical protein